MSALYCLPKTSTATLGLSLLFIFGLSACTENTFSWSFAGQVMGTRYHIVLTDQPDVAVHEGLQRLDKASVENALIEMMDDVNDSMSSYYAQSEVSLFNALSVGQCLSISEMFAEVLEVSRKAHIVTQGAFDITVAPLVDLWGFGAIASNNQLPGQAQIQAARRQMGMDALHSDKQSLCKQRQVQIDLSGVAKGYAVDSVARAIEAMGVRNYLIEIGGETRVSGTNPRGKPWVIGLEKPELLSGRVQQALQLGNNAVATSGSYRNFFSVDGKQYSHILDPRQGEPVERDIISLSVVDASTARADALATGLLVLGSKKVQALALEQSMPVYLMIADESVSEGYSDWYSPAMARFLMKPY